MSWNLDRACLEVRPNVCWFFVPSFDERIGPGPTTCGVARRGAWRSEGVMHLDAIPGGFRPRRGPPAPRRVKGAHRAALKTRADARSIGRWAGGDPSRSSRARPRGRDTRRRRGASPTDRGAPTCGGGGPSKSRGAPLADDAEPKEGFLPSSSIQPAGQQLGGPATASTIGSGPRAGGCSRSVGRGAWRAAPRRSPTSAARFHP